MANYICSSCGDIGPAKTRTPGSFLVELLLWIFFLIPGLIYSLWRISNRKKICGLCEAEGVAKINSKKGKRIAKIKGYPTSAL